MLPRGWRGANREELLPPIGLGAAEKFLETVVVTCHMLSYVVICCHMGLSENRVPLKPMVNDQYPYEKWLFHWEYTQHFQTNPYVVISHFDPQAAKVNIFRRCSCAGMTPGGRRSADRSCAQCLCNSLRIPDVSFQH